MLRQQMPANVHSSKCLLIHDDPTSSLLCRCIQVSLSTWQQLQQVLVEGRDRQQVCTVLLLLGRLLLLLLYAASACSCCAWWQRLLLLCCVLLIQHSSPCSQQLQLHLSHCGIVLQPERFSCIPSA
jgi:hypothetical protein